LRVLDGVPAAAAYAAGKGAVFALTNVAARDLAPFGITVNAVNPASTDTRMVTNAVARGQAAGGAAAERAAKLLATMQTPDDVARVIVALCLDEAAGITGQVFFVERDRVGLFRPLAVDQEVQIARQRMIERENGDRGMIPSDIGLNASNDD
jgi:NAD(P)-dependent dehydrogenase (short-subunit alcohol dehydrogenase family)